MRTKIDAEHNQNHKHGACTGYRQNLSSRQHAAVIVVMYPAVTMQEESYFLATLNKLYLLFLGVRVLVVVDQQYIGRFWPCYESWLSLRAIGKYLGLEQAQPWEVRVDFWPTMTCSKSQAEVSKMQWLRKTPEQAFAELSSDDILVTNHKDKQGQLRVLRTLADDCRALWKLTLEGKAKPKDLLGGQQDLLPCREMMPGACDIPANLCVQDAPPPPTDMVATQSGMAQPAEPASQQDAAQRSSASVGEDTLQSSGMVQTDLGCTVAGVQTEVSTCLTYSCLLTQTRNGCKSRTGTLWPQTHGQRNNANMYSANASTNSGD